MHGRIRKSFAMWWSFFSDNGGVVQSKRLYVVVDGKNQEFQKELDRYGLSRVMELENIKDHRTDCVLRYYMGPRE